MDKRRFWRIGSRVAVIMLIAAAAFFVWPRSDRRWRKPQITVRFLGMTNDASGMRMRLAKFEVRNADDRELFVALPGYLDLGMRGGGYFGFTNAILKPGASLETCVEAPWTQERWRVEFLCSIPLNFMQNVKNRAADLGLPVLRTGQDVTHAYSEWLNPTQEINWNDWLQLQDQSTNPQPLK